MKWMMTAIAVCLLGITAVQAQKDNKVPADSIEYSEFEAIVSKKFGVFITVTAPEWDDAPYQNLIVDYMIYADKDNNKTGLTGWTPLIQAKVRNIKGDNVEIEILQDIIIESGKKGISYTVKEGDRIKLRWPEESY